MRKIKTFIIVYLQKSDSDHPWGKREKDRDIEREITLYLSPSWLPVLQFITLICALKSFIEAKNYSYDRFKPRLKLSLKSSIIYLGSRRTV